MSTARYDGIADWYDAFARAEGSGWMQTAERLIVELLGSGPGRCLDLGCGTGVFVPTLVDQGWTVVGVDLSSDQLRVARSGIAELAEDLVQADACELPSTRNRSTRWLLRSSIRTSTGTTSRCGRSRAS